MMSTRQNPSNLNKARSFSRGRKGASNWKFCHTDPPEGLCEDLITIWNHGIPWGGSDVPRGDYRMTTADAELLRKHVELAFDSPPFAQMCKGQSVLTVRGRNAQYKDPFQRIECSFCRATTGCFKIQGSRLDCECTNVVCGKMCKRDGNRNIYPLIRLNCDHARDCPIGPKGQYRNSLVESVPIDILAAEAEYIDDDNK